MGCFPLSCQGLATVTEQEFFDIWLNVDSPRPVTYRLYHDEHGRLLFYSMEDRPGLWVEIDQTMFSRSPSRVRVINKQVHELAWRQSVKLRPGQTGIPCYSGDVTIVHDSPDARRWAITAHEQD